MEAAIIEHTSTCDMFDKGTSKCSCGWVGSVTMSELREHLLTHGQPTFRLNLNGQAMTTANDEAIEATLADPVLAAQVTDALASGDKARMAAIMGEPTKDLDIGLLAVWDGLSNITGRICLGDVINHMYGSGDAPAKKPAPRKAAAKKPAAAKAPAIAKGARVMLQKMNPACANGAVGTCGGLPPRARTRYLFTPDADIVDEGGNVLVAAGSAVRVPLNGLLVIE